MSGTPIETERKFLIRMPHPDELAEASVKAIEQTYLETDDSCNARVRRIVTDNGVSYVKTVKRRLSVLSCLEEEGEISEAQYLEELKSADKTKKTVVKTRYALPYRGHTVEIDVYPFWSDRAILEVELASEDESFELPAFVDVIKEVSDDGRYKNTNLAADVPYDII